MAERYRKVDPRFWTDERVVLLAPEEKLIALYCFTGQANRIGLYCFSPGRAAEETALSPQTFGKGFGKVRQTLHFGWHEPTRVLYLPTWWKYNTPENPNVLKACLGDLHDVPRTPLSTAFCGNLTHLPETFHQTFRATVETFVKGWGERMADQEQEQEQEARARTGSPPNPPAGGSAADPPDFEGFWKAYPRKVGKAAAQRVWRKVVKGNGFLDRVLQALAQQGKSDQWTREGGRFIPHPATWLRDGRWEDELPRSGEEEPYGFER